MTPSLARLTFIGALGLMVALLTAPADACGCGVVIPLDGDANIAKEIALIRWEGGIEDIVMQLNVEGNSREAAWILPVPAPATVQLSDPKLFDTLDEFTKPIVKPIYQFQLPFTLGAGAAPSLAERSVTLITRQTLGPFDVSTLAASDANALSDWLKTNGYAFPKGLADVLRPYVEESWFYVAVKLAPGNRDDQLAGALDPLWLTFRSDRIIYPMRPVALAPGDLPMLLYVLAEHRVSYPTDTRAFNASMTFADWIEPQLLEESSPLTPLVTRRSFLTKFEYHIFRPIDIDYDFVFTFAANDETYRDIQYESVYEFAGVPNFIWVCCIVPLGLFFAINFLRKRMRRAPAHT